MLRLAGWAADNLPTGVKRRLYHLGPLTRWLRSVLNRSAPKGPVEVEVAAGLLKGARLLLDLQEEKDLWLGTYETDMQSEVARRLEPGMVVYDIGAHIGYLTLGLARRVGPTGLVLAFEPLPGNQARLRSNVEANGFGERVILRPVAVGDQEGTGSFLVHPSASMGKLEQSAGRQEGYQQSIEVTTVTLDDEVYQRGAPPPDWVKLDVEGGEGAVLAGSQRLLTEARPGWWIELHGPVGARQAWDWLTQAGYELYTLGNRPARVLSADELDWKAYLLALPAEVGADG